MDCRTMEHTYVELIPRRNIVDCADFNTQDLSIFIESMETLTRVEQQRHERRLRRKARKLNPSNQTIKVDVRPSAIDDNTNSSEAEEDPLKHSKPICPKQLRSKLFTAMSKNKISPEHSSDENYFSGPSRSESPTETSGSKELIPIIPFSIPSSGDSGAESENKEINGINPLPSVDSGTESENGIYQLRPRTTVITNPKYRSTRARIIGLVLKKEYTDGGSQDELEKQERRERLLQGLLREKEKCESMRTLSNGKRKSFLRKTNKQATAEMRFIDKALRYLTL